MKKLLVVVLSIIFLVGCDPTTTDDPTKAGAVKLNGDSSITIIVGTDYLDAGAYVEGDSSKELSVEKNVDTNTIGTYTVVYSYVLDGTTYRATRTVHVVADTTGEVTVTCTLVGPSTINLVIGDTYSEPGVTCTPEVEVSIDNPVDVNTAGTYEITYSYPSRGVTESISRTVIVSLDYSKGTFTFEGNSWVELNQGDSWIDPGYNATGINKVVTVSGEVDTSVPGLYEIEYAYKLYDNDDNVVFEETYIRKVNVNQTIFFEFIDVNLGVSEMLVRIKGINIINKYYESYIDFYEDEVLVRSMPVNEGDNDLLFENVNDGHLYEVFFRGLFTNEGGAPDKDEVLLYTADLRGYESTSIEIKNVIQGTDSITFDYVITDSSSRFKEIKIVTSTGGLVVDERTGVTDLTGTITVENLDDYTVYEIAISLEYERTPGNNVTASMTAIVPTLLDFSYTSAVEYETVVEGESNSLTLTLDNPNNYVITDIKIGDASVSFNSIDSSTITIDLDTTTVGVVDLTLSEITIHVDGEDIVREESIVFSYTVEAAVEPVFPDMIDFYFFDDYTATTTFPSYREFVAVFANYYQYDISNVGINSVLADPLAITSDNNETIQFKKHGQQATESGVFEITEDGVATEYSITNKLSDYLPICDTFTEVVTKEDVNNMILNGDGCYKLVNDIDMTGANLHVVSLNHTTSNLVLFGQGFQLYNVSMLGTRELNQNHFMGLFGKLEDSYIVDLKLDYTFSMTNTSGVMSAGGLAGEMTNTYLRNIDVTGVMNPSAPSTGHWAGLVGKAIESFITDVTVEVDMTIDGEITTVAGLVGWADSTVLNAVAFQGGFIYTSENVLDGNYAGGLVGYLNDSVILNSYNSSIITANVEYAGGLIGQMDYTSVLYRVYNTADVTNYGDYTGGIIGYNKSGVLKKVVSTGDVYGVTYNAGLIYGYDNSYGTYEDTYYNNSGVVYNADAVIPSIDANQAGLTGEDVTVIETRAFFEQLLNYTDYWYDLDAMVSNSYPVFY